MTQTLRPSRSLRYAAYLAILFGLAGGVIGIVGALTFVPSRQLDDLGLNLARNLAVVSAVGAAASFPGIVSGVALLRMRSWAPAGMLGAAAGSIASVTVMAAIWSVSFPFLPVVAVFYAIELFLLGHGSIEAARRVGKPSGAAVYAARR